MGTRCCPGWALLWVPGLRTGLAPGTCDAASKEGAWHGRGMVPPRSAPALLTPPGSAPERKVSVLSELRSVSAREGDGATFECTVSEVETAGSWELGGRLLRPGGRVRIRQEGRPTLPSLAPLLPYPPAQTDPALRSTSSSDESRPAAPEAVSPPLPDLLLRSPGSWTAPSSPSASPFLPGTYSGPIFMPPPSPEAAPASLAPPIPPGKKHILVLSELRAEDAGEVCFQAGPAQSVAQLEVEGKNWGRDDQE